MDTASQSAKTNVEKSLTRSNKTRETSKGAPLASAVRSQTTTPKIYLYLYISLSLSLYIYIFRFLFFQNILGLREAQGFCAPQTPHCGRLEDFMDDVRASSAYVASLSSHVVVDSAGIEKVVSTIDSIPRVEWDFEGIHYFDNGPLTVQYLLVLDALNFCFWPDEDLTYEHLAAGLKASLQNDKSVFDADRLQKYTGPKLRQLLRWPRPLPLEEERVRLLHEVGFELERSFDGKACNLVKSCGKSALNLVALVARHFPGFRDHSVYKGRQVFLYKRAQIFAADLWGAFRGQGYGEFKDISSITIMADYIVPAVLRQLGVLKYSPKLASTIEASGEIGPGTEEEVELRACSVHAVEKMRELISFKSGRQVLSVELDLWLWASGVQCPSLQHHRTLSIYY